MDWNETSKGLGDSVAKVANAIGADKIAAAWSNTTGKDCGCKKRQEALNKMFPYDNE